MTHWPPHTVLVYLDQRIHYYDRETGEQLCTKYIAVNSRHPDIHCADQARVDIFPCDADGNFVEDTMMPIRKVPFTRISKVLGDLGFDVVDDDDVLAVMPGG
jgi:hypothetical protein